MGEAKRIKTQKVPGGIIFYNDNVKPSDLLLDVETREVKDGSNENSQDNSNTNIEGGSQTDAAKNQDNSGQENKIENKADQKSDS